MFTFGQAADVDPAVLAVMAGPDGLGGQAFTQQQMAEAMPPGPLLAALTENAAADAQGLSDDGLLGVISAARRLAARAGYLELAAIAEFTVRRQGQLAASAARKDPRGQRAGEFADAELGMHLQVCGHQAGNRMDQAVALTTRLPATFAGLGAGTITADNAYSIWFYTRFLSDADAAEADAILAAAAPGIRQETLAAKAAKLEMKLDPQAARARKEHARKDGRRVEARRELSGNMSYGGRELAAEEALAVSAAVEADAAALRRAGMDGTLRDLRVACFLDRLLGRNLLRALNITWAPIAKGTCDHRHREDRYKPSRKLGHLVRARTATCPAPGCGASAYHADLDHTVPWPKGPSDECNIAPPCRHHHRVKQAPGWRLEQTSPGVMRWTAPSGRTYTTTPTVYDI